MNPQNGQTPLDYLNQIAPQAPKKQLFALNMRTVLLGAIAAVILIIIIAIVAGALTSARKDPWVRFAARLNATATLVDSSSTKIKNSQLRSINSDVKLYITNTQRDLQAPLTKMNIDSAKLPENIVAQESSAEMAQRLEDGRLNAKFDSTYSREMSYQLATILALLQELYASSGQQETKDFLEGAYNNLEPSYKAVADFSASNE